MTFSEWLDEKRPEWEKWQHKTDNDVKEGNGNDGNRGEVTEEG